MKEVGHSSHVFGGDHDNQSYYYCLHNCSPVDKMLPIETCLVVGSWCDERSRNYSVVGHTAWNFLVPAGEEL